MYDEHVKAPSIIYLPRRKDVDGCVQILQDEDIVDICHHMLDGWSDERIAFYFSHVPANIIKSIRLKEYDFDICSKYTYNSIQTNQDKAYSVATLHVDNPDFTLADLATVENITQIDAQACLEFAHELGFF
jgi:hypothetical protein